jgi:hypothetical protein
VSWIDYWCNAFTPDRKALWEQSLAAQGASLRIREGEDDSFVEAAELLARMDSLDVGTLVLPACDLPPHAGLTDYEPFASRFEETAELAKRHPGRFVAAWSLDPRLGIAGVRRARDVLENDWAVALHLHTHSFDRRFDHADYYPYYALAGEYDVPVVMQAGASGGRMPSECGRPIGIDRPAIYFPEVRFVLSHTGWPWEREAIAMASKFSNVFLGTATQPPRHWPAELAQFARGAGREKLLVGTGFPVAGHRHVLAQLDALEVDSELKRVWLDDNPRAVFSRIT